MLDILSLPDSFERRFYVQADDAATFEAGEMVDLVQAAAGDPLLITAIAVQPTVPIPYPIFQDTEARLEVGDVLATGGTTVIEGPIDARTDQFEDGLEGEAQGDFLTVTAGLWALAAVGEMVYGVMVEVPEDTADNGGIMRFRSFSSPYALQA